MNLYFHFGDLYLDAFKSKNPYSYGLGVSLGGNISSAYQRINEILETIEGITSLG